MLVTRINADALATPRTIHANPYQLAVVSTKNPTIETTQKAKLSQIACPKYDTKSLTYVVSLIRCMTGESNVITMAFAVARNPVKIAPSVNDDDNTGVPFGNDMPSCHQANAAASAAIYGTVLSTNREVIS